MTSGQILEHDVVVVSNDQVSADLQGEEVILNLRDGVYYGLNAVGAHVWSLIQKPKTVKEIQDILLEEFDVESDQCARELRALLQDMVARGLIEVRHESFA